MTVDVDVIAPQAGPQTAFLASPADIRIFGGAAGGGKTFAILLELLRYVHEPKYRAAVFRRTYPELRQPGGIWDDAARVFGAIPGASAHQVEMTWRFPSGAEIKFSHLQTERDVYAWQGARLDVIAFDEASHFSRSQILYLLSRLGSTSGLPPSVLMGTNPDPDAFVAELISWWLDDNGFPIPERSGALRWFVRDGDGFAWADTREALAEQGAEPKSLTFIPSRLQDNPALTSTNPNYRSNLLALDKVHRERLLGGNWLIRSEAGKVFNKSWFPIVSSAPQLLRTVRAWDCAGTEGAGDWTAGVKLGEVHPADGGGWIVLDVVRDRWAAGKRDTAIRRTAERDGVGTLVKIEQEGGSAGKDRAKAHTAMLAGFRVKLEPSTGSKVVRAQPLSAQAEAGLVRVLRAPWTDAFLNELHSFPDGKYDDQVDAVCSAFNALAGAPKTRGGIYSLYDHNMRAGYRLG